MKHFITILFCLLAAVSCNSLEDGHDQNSQNPLNECVIPALLQAGEEALIQWNGFTDAARIFLVSADGQEVEIPIKVLTDSGIMFVVPSGLPAGTYTLVLDQDGRKELGSMEISAADIPVTGLKVPSGVIIGDELIIEGLGFQDDCSIVLVSENGDEFTVETVLVGSGISTILTEDILHGNYALYLVQDGNTWLLSSVFTAYENIKVKVLKQIDYYYPYLQDSRIKLTWEINREEPASLKLSEALIEGEEETLQVYDLYECTSENGFELTHDGFESSNDMAMSYTMDSDGLVTLADVLIYGNSQTTGFTWTYDSDGYLCDISSPTRSFRSLEYTDGNLTTFRNSSFEYGDAELVNNPYAPDVVWAYMAMMETNDPFVYIPFLLGWYTKASAQLPVAILLPSPTGTGTERYPLTYTFDEDGYVVKMAWEASEIVFHFEINS